MFLEDIVKEIEKEEAQKGAHSDIGASSTERWFNCPASVVLSEGEPDTTHPSAIEGTFYHKLAQLMLELKIADVDANMFIDETVELLGHSFKVKESMVEGVIMYCSEVRRRQCKSNVAMLFIEHKFCIDSVDPQAFGTADAIVNTPYESLDVIDLKTGSRPVSPESKQLKYYALGALEDCDTEFDKVNLCIIQLQAWSEEERVKVFELTREELMSFKEELKLAIKRVRDLQRTKYKPTITAEDVNVGDHCIYCKAKAICPGQQKKKEELLDNGFTEVVEQKKEISTIDTEKILWCLDNESNIKEFLNSVRSYATEKAKQGAQIPGYKLVKQGTNRKFTEEAEDFLTAKLGEKAYKITKKLLGLKAAEDALVVEHGYARKDAKEEIDKYTFNPDKGVVLAKENDKRPAVPTFDNVIDVEAIKELF